MNTKGKFVVVWDSIVDGWECSKDENNKPIIYNSYDEAFKEIFNDNLFMLQSHRDDKALEEYNEGVTPELVEEMEKILISDDVEAMKKFMENHPECDDSGEWVEPVETFFQNRKAIWSNNGLVIEGTPLNFNGSPKN